MLGLLISQRNEVRDLVVVAGLDPVSAATRRSGPPASTRFGRGHSPDASTEPDEDRASKASYEGPSACTSA